MPDNNEKDKKKKYQYSFPTDELDRILEQMQSGIQMMLSDEMQIELDMRYREKFEEITGEEYRDDDDSESNINRLKHQKMMKEKIAKDRMKASTKDVIVINISDEKKKEIREQMMTSIVRPNPNDPYNTTDDDLFRDTANKEIMEKLKGIKNCYYNQRDYINALKIIHEAIEFSLGKTGHGDYPWLSYPEAVKEYNAGKIKFSWCEIPKLIVNRVSPITDPEILKGVLTGDVVILNRTEDDDEIKKLNKKKMANYKPINVDYDVTGETEYNQMQAAHKAGYDTPWSTGIKYKNTSYDPTALPFSSIFSSNKIKQNNVPDLFDWEKDGAGNEYYNLMCGKKPSANDIAAVLNKDNNNQINPIITRNMNEFLYSMKHTNDNSGGYNYDMPNFIQAAENPNNFNADAAAIEKQLLASITMNNPLK